MVENYDPNDPNSEYAPQVAAARAAGKTPLIVYSSAKPKVYGLVVNGQSIDYNKFYREIEPNKQNVIIWAERPEEVKRAIASREEHRYKKYLKEKDAEQKAKEQPPPQLRDKEYLIRTIDPKTNEPLTGWQPRDVLKGSPEAAKEINSRLQAQALKENIQQSLFSRQAEARAKEAAQKLPALPEGFRGQVITDVKYGSEYLAAERKEQLLTQQLAIGKRGGREAELQKTQLQKSLFARQDILKTAEKEFSYFGETYGEGKYQVVVNASPGEPSTFSGELTQSPSYAPTPSGLISTAPQELALTTQSAKEAQHRKFLALNYEPPAFDLKENAKKYFAVSQEFVLGVDEALGYALSPKNIGITAAIVTAGYAFPILTTTAMIGYTAYETPKIQEAFAENPIRAAGNIGGAILTYELAGRVVETPLLKTKQFLDLPTKYRATKVEGVEFEQSYYTTKKGKLMQRQKVNLLVEEVSGKRVYPPKPRQRVMEFEGEFGAAFVSPSRKAQLLQKGKFESEIKLPVGKSQEFGMKLKSREVKEKQLSIDQERKLTLGEPEKFAKFEKGEAGTIRNEVSVSPYRKTITTKKDILAIGKTRQGEIVRVKTGELLTKKEVGVKGHKRLIEKEGTELSFAADKKISNKLTIGGEKIPRGEMLLSKQTFIGALRAKSRAPKPKKGETPSFDTAVFADDKGNFALLKKQASQLSAQVLKQKFKPSSPIIDVKTTRGRALQLISETKQKEKALTDTKAEVKPIFQIKSTQNLRFAQLTEVVSETELRRGNRGKDKPVVEVISSQRSRTIGELFTDLFSEEKTKGAQKPIVDVRLREKQIQKSDVVPRQDYGQSYEQKFKEDSRLKDKLKLTRMLTAESRKPKFSPKNFFQIAPAKAMKSLVTPRADFFSLNISSIKFGRATNPSLSVREQRRFKGKLLQGAQFFPTVELRRAFKIF